MAAWEGELLERLLYIALKALASAVLLAAGRKAEDLVTSLVCRASGGCPERARGIGQRSAERLDARARRRLEAAFRPEPDPPPAPVNETPRQGAARARAAGAPPVTSDSASPTSRSL